MGHGRNRVRFTCDPSGCDPPEPIATRAAMYVQSKRYFKIWRTGCAEMWTRDGQDGRGARVTLVTRKLEHSTDNLGVPVGADRYSRRGGEPWVAWFWDADERSSVVLSAGARTAPS